MKFHIKYLVILFLSLLAFQVSAQELLTLKDALQIAMENNFSILLAKNEQDILRRNNAAGNAGMLPTLTGSLNQDNTTTNTRQRFLNGSTNDRNAAKADNLNASVELGWTVFDGFKMFATKSRLEQLHQQGELRVKAQMEQVAMRVCKAYYELILAQQQLHVQRANDELSRKRYEWVQNRLKAGKAAESELWNADADREADKAALLKQEVYVGNLSMQLNQLLGRDLAINFTIDTTLSAEQAIEISLLEKNLEQNNTALQSLRKSLSIQLSSLREVEAERYPTVTVRGGYSMNRSNSEAGFLQQASNNGYHYGAGVSMNIFNGFQVNRKIANTKLGLKSVELVYKDSVNRVRLNLMQQYRAYQTAQEVKKVEQARVAAALRYANLASTQYQQGLINAIEFRQAQQNLMAAKLAYYAACNAILLSETDLKLLSGTLL